VFTERGLLIIIEELNNDLTHCQENEPQGKQEPICQVQTLILKRLSSPVTTNVELNDLLGRKFG
jgi:hypothetical protein